AFAHADVPFERLVEVLNPERSTARHPLFQVGFSFQNQGETSLELPGVSISEFRLEHHTTQFDLHWIVQDTYDESGVPSGIGGFVTYATALFDEGTVVSFVERFGRVLEAVAADVSVPVGGIEILSANERTRILESFNDSARAVDGSATLVSLFEAQVAAAPDAVAVEFGGRSWTYGRLDEWAAQVARRLVELGVGAEARVALGMRRSVELIVGMVAVAKAGGAYVPVDPEQPAERTEYILGTADPVCVLTTGRDGFGVEGARPVVIVAEPETFSAGGSVAVPLPAHTAYVIFTSGSTGRPKGVAVPHAAIANQLVWKRAAFGLGAQDAVLLKTAATFDLSVWEFWSALVSGGRVVVAEPEGHRDPQYLLGLIEAGRVSTLHVVPSMLEALHAAAGGALPGSLRRVLAIGEALPADLAAAVRSVNPRVGLFNLYGPTEAAVSVTWHEVGDADVASVPIGAPVWNSRVFVLDGRLRPVPVGVAGELYLAGVQLARGYHGRPELTAERFVADPFAGDGSRLYRTGDLVRWTAGGELDYLGRTDFQVKVRGFRIELGEIEAVLRAQPQVVGAVVAVRSDPRTGERLVGYVVPEAAAGTGIDTGALSAAVGEVLPSYMVPSAWVVLEALPLNVNGKVDRRALPEPVFEAAVFRAPVTPVEQIVASVFT
ncbi:non-ribosomal peptide synthetase, partial [Rhodococcus aetherivorans]